MRKITFLLGLALALPASVLAQASLPYSQSFDSESGFQTFTVIDGNDDGTTWAYDDWNYQAACSRNAYAGADDWLVSPVFHLTKDTQYELKLAAKTVYDGTTENFVVKLGTSASDTASFTQTVLSNGTADNSYTPSNYTVKFTVENDGDYYIGFHYLTSGQNFSSGLGIDDISLTGTAIQTENPPKPVSDVTFSYNYSSSVTTLKWKAPTQFEDGTDITTPVTYSVRRLGSTTKLLEDYPGTTFHEQVTLRDLPSSSVLFGQALVRYAITATTNGLSSSEALSPFKVIGTPDDLPYSESFAGGTLHHYWGQSHTGVGRWGEMQVSNSYSQDADQGVFSFTAVNKGDNSLGFSGLINLGQATNPTLSFWYQYMSSNDEQADTLYVQVAKNGGDFTTVKELQVNAADSCRQWLHVELPLSDYVGSDFIQVAFFAKSGTGTTTYYLDNLSVYNKLDNDLALSTVCLPGRLRTDEQRKATFKVDNLGMSGVDGENYSVVVMANDKVIGQAQGVSLESGASTELPVLLTADAALSNDSVDCYAQLRFDADEYTANNTTDSVRLFVAEPGFPAPNALKAVANGSEVALSWQQPDEPRQTSTAVTDGFESSPDFTISNWGDWTLYDGSQLPVYGVNNLDFPNSTLPQAFTVFNPSAVNASASWTPHTGDKELASFCVMGNTSDHWLISPTLSGEAQTVTFWARAYSKQYEEDFEFCYSTTSVDTEDFNTVEAVQLKNDNEWKQYTYEVPAGTRYFAIHATSYDAFALLFDDFTFIPDSTGRQDIVLTGYNVYRDGVKITSEPVSATAFTDEALAGDHLYTVSAVYDKGESKLSDAAAVTVVDGIVRTPETTVNSNAAVYDLQGRRVNNPSARGIYIRGGKKFVVK